MPFLPPNQQRQEYTHSIISYQLFLSNSNARRTELESSLLVRFVNRRRIFKTSEIWIIPGIHETRRHSTYIANTIHMSGRTDTYKRPVAISQNKQIQPLASLILMGDWHNNFWASACPRRIQSNSGMHHYKCIALCKDISLQRG